MYILKTKTLKSEDSLKILIPERMKALVTETEALYMLIDKKVIKCKTPPLHGAKIIWIANLDCELDHNPEDVPVYMGHSLFNTLQVHNIVLSLLHCNPPNVLIKIIQITIQMECLHATKFLDPDNLCSV